MGVIKFDVQTVDELKVAENWLFNLKLPFEDMRAEIHGSQIGDFYYTARHVNELGYMTFITEN